MRVSIKNLSKRLGTTLAVDNVTLEVGDEELFFLLGPSGCGKTSLLRLLAGFYEPDDGTIQFGDRLMNGVPPHRRNTGMVFQNYALWPHMTVAKNVAYGLEVRALGENERKAQVAAALATVQMEAFADRMPNQLSGGQQQRVALARALVIETDVLLLDEPLSNLDARLRLEMRNEIRRIHEQTRLTTIYVTHDQKEAMSLANRLAVVRAGRVEQVGDPQILYRAPANRFVAEFLGEMNWVKGRVCGIEEQVVTVETILGVLRASRKDGCVPNQEVAVGFRPEAVRLGAHELNSFKGTIERSTYLGDIQQYELCAAPNLRIKAVEQNPPRLRQIEEVLMVNVQPQDLIIIPEQR